MKRVVVTGANGQVGQELQRSHPMEGCDFFFLSREELDITSPVSIEKVFRKIGPTHLINLAAYTNVEKAESEEKAACEINTLGPKHLAEACKKYDAVLIHLSTDYVFGDDGKDSHSPEDPPAPLNVYGKTKLDGELEISASGCKHVILRTSWVYSNHAQNFYLKMLQLSQKTSELNVINDQHGAPTSAKEICRALDKILSSESINSGTYHFSGTGKTTWKEFAVEIFKQAKIPMVVNGIPAVSYETKAKRPQNSYMSTLKFTEKFDYFPMHWKNALAEVISEKKISPIKVGYLTSIAGKRYVIASVDWAKQECVLAEIGNMERFFTLNFNDLYDI